MKYKNAKSLFFFLFNIRFEECLYKRCDKIEPRGKFVGVNLSSFWVGPNKHKKFHSWIHFWWKLN